MRRGWAPAAAALSFAGIIVSAQSVPPARLAILLADERSARDPRDLTTIRAGVRSADGETARVAVRALGRLRRPALTADIMAGLRSPLPEVRSETANALAQALSSAPPPAAAAVDSTFNALTAALDAEPVANVRAALLEAIGRLPYRDERQAHRASRVLVSHTQSDFVMDRLGVAKGLEALLRMSDRQWQPLAEAIAALRLLAFPAGQAPPAGEAPVPSPPPAESSAHDARVRRLAFEGLIAARAIDDAIVAGALADGDAQVRRLGIIAIQSAGVDRVWQAPLQAGLADRAGLVRLEAVRALGQRQPGTPESCQLSVDATHDPEPQVMAAGFRNLGDCSMFPGLDAYLEQVVTGQAETPSRRGWAAAGRALEALARVSPDRARPLLQQLGESSLPQLRLHAARSAQSLGARDLLTKLADDPTPTVRSVARAGLGLAEPADSRSDAKGSAAASDLNAVDLRRLAAPRARVTISGLGTFDLALVTAEAPSAVLRFVRLAEGGAFDRTMIGDRSTTLIRVSPAANDPGTPADRTMTSVHAEPGLWPHVRGTVGLSSDGGATGGAQVFVNLVDNPSFDHQLTVFAQVLNGIDIVDRILDGDVIEKIEILP